MKKYLFCLFVLFCYCYSGFCQTDIGYYQKIRLSPIPQSVLNTSTAVLTLNGVWDFQIKEITNLKTQRIVKESGNQNTIQVPGEWEMQGYSVTDGETAVYTKRLNIPEDWKGKHIKIRFDGVSSYAAVKINGHLICTHEGSFVPFEADMTNYLQKKDNVLTVEVQANTISDKLACTSQYAAHTVGGLLRDVRIFALPDLNISGEAIQTVFDRQFKDASLQIETWLTNEDNTINSKFKALQPELRYTLRDELGKKVLQKSFSVKKNPSGNSENLSHILKVNQPEKWNPEHPYLYELTTELLLDGKVQQVNKQKIGFRQVEVKGNILLVNDKSVRLHGVNRHSIYPTTGRSVSAALDREDALLFRNANCNYIRTSHYPPSEAFLNACDSLGLFVESESSLCWINHGASPIWKLWNYKDPKFLPFMLRANIEKMLADRNHPSVIIWSLGNESVWSPLWDSVNKMVKRFDPSRPTSFHDQCWGSYNNAGSKADIAVYHYPDLNGPGACDTMKRPVLFGEYAHISCYNRHELLTDPGIRSSYGKPLERMYDSMYAHPANLGGAIWSGIDDFFKMPDGRIIGYGPWGPIDGWRRPKPEYWGVKKAYTPIRIWGIDSPVISHGQLILCVENRYDFTNLNEVHILCRVDGKEIPVSLNLLPHHRGELSIPVTADNREVYLSFKDPRGFMVNEEKVILKSEAESESEASASLGKLKAHIVEMQQNNAAFFIQVGDVHYEISKTTGLLSSAFRDGKLVLAQGPVFGIVPISTDNGGKPTVANESYQNDISLLKNYAFIPLFATRVSAIKTDSGMLITSEIMYQKANGTQSYFFSSNGRVKVSYKITCTDPDIARQFGLMMQLPKSFDYLHWNRKGEFSTYPDDDIARIKGDAKLDAKQGKAAEMIGDGSSMHWKDDANEYGSNDFRSTKSHIYSASLSDGNNSFTILSNGTQCSRAWLQDERIQLLVADYNSQGSEPFYTYPFTSKRENLKAQLLSGMITFEIGSANAGIK